MKTISVIIPFFNAERYLKQCVLSVMSQTYKNYELILINDGSTDDSLSVLSGFDTSSLIIINQNNKGVSAARNAGLRAAKGDYICFLDADDILEPYFLQSMLELITRTDCDIVFGGYKLFYSNKMIVKKEPRIDEGKYFASYFLDKCIDDGTLTGILFGSVCGALYRTALLKESCVFFNESIRINEDGVFNVELLSFAGNVYVTHDSHYIYRQWKNKRKKDISFETTELDKATSALKAINSHIPNIEQQLSRRKVSILFWSSLRIENSSLSLLKIKNKLRLYFRSNSILIDNYDSLDFNSINRHKLFLIKLLKNGHFFFYTFLINKVLPIAKKIFKH